MVKMLARTANTSVMAARWRQRTKRPKIVQNDKNINSMADQDSQCSSEYSDALDITELTESAVMANWGAVHSSGVTGLRRHRERKHKGTEHPKQDANYYIETKADRERESSQSGRKTVASLNSNSVEVSLLQEYSSVGNPSKAFIPQKLPKKFHDCKIAGCEIVTINVSGLIFEIRVGLLNRHPSTLLGCPAKRKRYYDRERNEYFFDRHRLTFEAIFHYYKYGGKLKRPTNLTDEVFLEELEFYEIEKDVVDQYKYSEGYREETVELPKNPHARRIWILFEYPETSTVAFIVAIISVVVTLLSIIVFCLETLPSFADGSHCNENDQPNFLDTFFLIETLCTAWFTFEFSLRLCACPRKIGFFKDWKNWVDAGAVLPYYITLINVLSSMSCSKAKSSSSLAFLRVIRLVRVFKLTKHSSGLQVLMMTFSASLEGLGLFLLALIVCMLMFSSAIYFADISEENSKIESIPGAFWWCIITMCTVGYGDVVPVGLWGKLVGSLCALAGVLTLAIPVPIITENFNKFYTHRSSKSGKIV